MDLTTARRALTALAIGAIGAGCGGPVPDDAAGPDPGEPVTTQAKVARTPAGPVVWTDLVNTTVTGGTVTKTGGDPNAEDAGAVSEQTIAWGEGAFEFTVDERTRVRFVGLGQGATWTGAAGIDFGFRLQAGHADVYEHGTWTANVDMQVGDVLRIDVAGGAVVYSKNGVAQYTSA